MSDPVIHQLMLMLTSHGTAVLQDRARLEAMLTQSCGAYPGKVKALLTLFDKKAVNFLAGWAKDTRPGKMSFDQMRQALAAKFAQANLLNLQAASWAVEAWSIALGLRPAPAAVPGLTSPAPRSAPRPPASPPRDAAGVSAAQANVYAPPSARVEDPTTPSDDEDGRFVQEARGVGAGQGWQWIVEGWKLFKGSPGIWIVNVVLFAIVSIAVQLVPLLGGVASALLSPVFYAGIMLGADALRRGEPLEVAHVFAGFKQRTGTLMVVGLLYLLAIVAVLLVVVAIFGFGTFTALSSKNIDAVLANLALIALVAAALILPVFMAYLYAPALVVFNELSAPAAMKASFLACLKNIWPGLVYSLVFLVLAVVASLPLLLGWLILGPVAAASIYASYRDVFYEH